MKKQVLFLSPGYAPNIGGVETHVRAVAESLVKQGWSVTVLTTTRVKEAAHSETILGVKVNRLLATQKQQKLAIWRWIRSHKQLFAAADIVHVHDVGWWIVPVWLSIRHKLFVTFHGWEGEWPVRWQAKLHRYVLAKLSRATVHIGHWIKYYYWDLPKLVLYGGVSHRVKPLKKNEKWSRQEKKLNIVFVGRLVKENDLEEYCRFAELIHQQQVTVAITWVGDGPYRKQCAQYGRVTGMVKQPERKIKEADVVWASSYLSILTARGYGKPVWSLWNTPLKQAYLQSLPNQYGITLADTADSLWRKVYDQKLSKWRLPAVQPSYSSTWPPTWEEVTAEYQLLWRTYGKN